MNKIKISDQAFVREQNTSVVMDYLRLYAPLSRAELAARSGLNRSTISVIINDLIDRGFVHETTRQDPTIGRPGLLLQFNPDGGFAIGVEIGVDFISVVVTNFIAEVLWRKCQTNLMGLPQIEMMQRAEDLITEAMAFGLSRGLRALGIGVGVPGLVDARQGKLVYAPNLQWTDLPIRLIWMSRYNLPVFVENEANCAALGEHFYGIAHDVQDLIYLKTGVGLGGGILMDGRLFRGSQGFGGEVGHTSLYSNGPQCGCGRVGCWETYVSPHAILSLVEQKLAAGAASLLHSLAAGDPSQPVDPCQDRSGAHTLSLEMIVRAAEQNDPLAVETIHETAQHLGVGIANLINTFNPELIVLGGALAQFTPWLIPDIVHMLQEIVLPPLREGVRVEASVHGLDASVLGAIALVLNNIVREPLYSMER